MTLTYTVLELLLQLGWLLARITIGFNLITNVGAIVNYLSGRRMQRFLQFRLSSHSLSIVTGRFAGQHVARADRTCSHCADRSVADELHVVSECHALRPVRQQYAALFTSDTDTMRSFFGQKDHMQLFSFILDCLDFLDI